MMRRRSRKTYSTETLECRVLLSATVFESDGVGYFLNSDPSRVERYDAAAEAWLDPVELSSPTGDPTVAHIDDDGYYAAFGKTVYRYDLDGSNRTHLLNAASNVSSILTDGNLLILLHGSDAVSIDKNTNTVIDAADFRYSLRGPSIQTDLNYIFARDSGVSPSDIRYLNYDDDGKFGSLRDSPYHGDFPGASETWVFPDGSKVVDSSGTIYQTEGLTWWKSFGADVDDIGFQDDGTPIVLDGDKLVRFNEKMLPVADATLPEEAAHMLLSDVSAIVFVEDANAASGYTPTVVPLDDLQAPVPGDPVNPVGLEYTPDTIKVTPDGTLLLFSAEHKSVFRWDSQRQAYGTTIPLVGDPEFMTYSPTSGVMYIADEAGLIREMDLSAASPSLEPFASLPQSPIGLSMAGDYVFAADPSGAWVSHYTFAPDGELVENVEWNYFSEEYVWNEANQKMYFFRDSTSPNDLLWEEINADGETYPDEPAGGIGRRQDSPDHSSAGIQHPIRVKPDGSKVVLGSGIIRDGLTLERDVLALGNEVVDSVWDGDDILAIRSIAGVTQYQRWTAPTWELTNVAQTNGSAHAMVGTEDGRLVAVRLVADVPVFDVMDRQFEAASRIGSHDLNTVCQPRNSGVALDGRSLIVVGTNGPDSISITEEASVLTVTMGDQNSQYTMIDEIVVCGLKGRDEIVIDSAKPSMIHGGNGPDRITGGSGPDLISGGSGKDNISSGEGPDSLFGGAGNDLLAAGPGRDFIQGGSGADDLRGGGGSDRLEGSHGGDRIQGGGGADVILGGRGHDFANGGAGSDIIDGFVGDDTLLGGAAGDLLVGGEHADSLEGQAGDDLVVSGSIAMTSQAMQSVFKEWTADRSYEERVANLRDGSGSEQRLNGKVYLVATGDEQTVFGDDNLDSIMGMSDRDWFFAAPDQDDLLDRLDTEELDVL
jgi:Ca2+-binding RTX toxin-like protein